MGGGTAKLVAALADNFSSVGGSNLICTRIIDRWLRGPVYEVHWHERGLTLRLPPAAIVDLVLRVETISFLGAVILVHSLTGFGPEIYAVTEATRLPYIVYVHDYQWFCPRVVLVDQSEKYCGEPGESYCQSCVRINSIFDFAEDNDLIHHDLARWVDKNAALLECAHAVVVPSNDAAKRIATHFNNIIPRCVPHPEPLDQFLITRVPDLNHQTRIAVVGGISVQKGRDVLRNLARYIDATSAPVSIEVIGSVADPAQFVGIECMRVTGSYHPNELFARLAGYHPHFVFFPGVWPETYSFVLSEVWAAGYPAVAFDIGAIAERIRATGAGVVLPFEPMPAALLLRLQDARRQTAYLAGLECRRRPAGSSSEDPVADLFRAFSRLV
jgi:glycosyltransferase involved in cell wall biosynthesis